jgi:hypothetical protein
MQNTDTISDIRRTFSATAVYPQQVECTYLTAGLLSEMGELANVVKKIVRGDKSVDEMRERILDEYGDVCWYAVMRTSLESEQLSYNELAEWAREFTIELTATDTLGTPLLGNAAALCEYLSDAMLQLLEAERSDVEVVSDLGVVLAGFLGEDRFVFAESCESVKKKLQDRATRGVIRGDGDNR